MAVHLSFLLLLTGLTGIHSITTVSKVSVKAGGSISIPCLYESRYINNVKYLCKGSDWNSCSYAVKTHKQSSGKFSISDDKIQRIFTVTIKDLMEQDAGYYWCVVEINDGGDNGKYFHLSVTRVTPSLYVDHQEITGVIGEKITIKCYHGYPGVIQWCRLGGSCVTEPSGLIDGTEVTTDRSVPNVFTVAMIVLKTESSGWYWCVQGDLQMPVHLTVREKSTTEKAATTVDSEEHRSEVLHGSS
ncbi:polymeric immunoglobulin receptor-like [Pagrus major]|uniref:polymeric immunoglobulin receptor-like n=1 Tax=Pagrus major TaxID=143350 RepID=UPI003CC8D80B